MGMDVSEIRLSARRMIFLSCGDPVAIILTMTIHLTIKMKVTLILIPWWQKSSDEGQLSSSFLVVHKVWMVLNDKLLMCVMIQKLSYIHGVYVSIMETSCWSSCVVAGDSCCVCLLFKCYPFLILPCCWMIVNVILTVTIWRHDRGIANLTNKTAGWNGSKSYISGLVVIHLMALTKLWILISFHNQTRRRKHSFSHWQHVELMLQKRTKIDTITHELPMCLIWSEVMFLNQSAGWFEALDKTEPVSAVLWVCEWE